MKILVATDGQTHSEAAIRFAAKLFHAVQPTYTLLHVHPLGQIADESLGVAKTYLTQGKKLLKGAGKRIRTKMRKGEVIEEILHELFEEHYNLLVLGYEKDSPVVLGLSEMLLPDTTRSIVDEADTSILLVRKEASVDRVSLYTDGSPFSEYALHWWGRLKKQHEPATTVFTIIPPVMKFDRFKDEWESVKDDVLQTLAQFPGPKRYFIKRACEILARYGIAVRPRLVETHYAADEILRYLHRGHYQLVVIGYRGRQGRFRDKTHSVAQRVLKGADTNVLVIKPRKGLDARF